MKVREILEAINTARRQLREGQKVKADTTLLDLQEKLLDAYGDKPQSTEPEK